MEVKEKVYWCAHLTKYVRSFDGDGLYLCESCARLVYKPNDEYVRERIITPLGTRINEVTPAYVIDPEGMQYIEVLGNPDPTYNEIMKIIAKGGVKLFIVPKKYPHISLDIQDIVKKIIKEESYYKCSSCDYKFRPEYLSYYQEGFHCHVCVHNSGVKGEDITMDKVMEKIEDRKRERSNRSWI